jgi:hypothetical protein
VKLGLPEKPSEQDRQITPSPASVHLRTDFSGVKVLVTDDNGYVLYIIVYSQFCKTHQYSQTCVLLCIGPPKLYLRLKAVNMLFRPLSSATKRDLSIKRFYDFRAVFRISVICVPFV